MAKREQPRKTVKNTLDMFSHKRRRGRPLKVVAAAVTGRAANYRVWLARLWGELSAPLLASETESDVVTAFQIALPGNNEFPPMAPLILEVIKDPSFPKRQQARINFLADSVAGQGVVTPRRSRDICAKGRIENAQKQQILRYEFWVECSCGYKGRSENHACKNCGAVIYLPLV